MPDAAEFTCPRRAETGRQAHGPDTWTTAAPIANSTGPCCTYCGSLHPDAFMQHIRNGWIIGPTDKPTKAYLDQPFSAGEIEYIKTSSIEWKTVRRLKLEAGLTEEEATAAADADWMQHEAPLVTGRTVAKFCYAHLSIEQQNEFLGLYNSGEMRLSYPGHLYVRPFFCAAAEVTR